MAVTGQLSDLSLAELIEFFCNQRKTGRLKVIYPGGAGYFYIQAGALVDARVGSLCGVDAVYYALTLPNASFKFSPAFEATRQTIHQPWTQVILEGLRRMDESVTSRDATTKGEPSNASAPTRSVKRFLHGKRINWSEIPLALAVDDSSEWGGARVMVSGVVAVAVLISIVALGAPADWFSRAKTSNAFVPPVAASKPEEQMPRAPDSENSLPAQPEGSQLSESGATESGKPTNNETTPTSRRERPKASASATKQSVESSTPATAEGPNKKQDSIKSAPKMVTVQVTYDEAGRVTQASGGDATALRIARQKRFPAGKAGSATITIPMN